MHGWWMQKRYLFIAWAGVTAACAGGQSGNEGELPAVPCAGEGALLEAVVVRAEAGCLELDVSRVVKSGLALRSGSDEIVFAGDSDPGVRLVGKLGVVYSLRSLFVPGDVVAALPVLWGDMLEFQVMPSDGDHVEGRWGGNKFTVSFTELASPQCEAILSERLVALDSSDTATQQTEPPQSPPNCAR